MANQIKKKYISPNAIDGSKILFQNNEAFKAKSNIEGQVGEAVELFKLDSSDVLQMLKMPQVSVDPSSGNDLVRKSWAVSQIGAEQTRAELAESALDGRLDILEGADTVSGSVAKALKDAKAYTDAEQTRAELAESALDGRLDILEGADTVAGSVAKAEKDAKDYADGIVATERERIDAILLASDADKDSFAEIVSLINSVDTENDNAFAGYVLSNDAAVADVVEDLAQEVLDRAAADETLQDAIDAEQSAREAADLTFVKLDGSRVMAGSLDMGSAAAQEYVLFTTDGVATTFTGTFPYSVAGSTYGGFWDNSVGGSGWADDNDGDGTIETIGGWSPSVTAASINYATGEYSITFSSAPAAGMEIAAYAEVTQAAVVHKISNLASGTVAGDAVNKGQLDALESSLDARLDTLEGAPEKLPLAGGTMTGAIQFSGSSTGTAIEGDGSGDLQDIIKNNGNLRLGSEYSVTITSGEGQVILKSLTPAWMGGGVSMMSAAHFDAASVNERFLKGLAPLSDIQSAGFVSVTDDFAAPKGYVDSEISSEATARSNADDALSDRLDILEADESSEGSVAKAEADAKAYADGIVADEQTRAELAEGALSDRLDAVEGIAVQFYKEKFVLTPMNISNGYIDLARAAIPSSMNAFVDRLAIFETDDYTVSLVGDKTRITFTGNLVSPSEEAVAADDVIRVCYASLAI